MASALRHLPCFVKRDTSFVSPGRPGAKPPVVCCSAAATSSLESLLDSSSRLKLHRRGQQLELNVLLIQAVLGGGRSRGGQASHLDMLEALGCCWGHGRVSALTDGDGSALEEVLLMRCRVCVFEEGRVAEAAGAALTDGEQSPGDDSGAGGAAAASPYTHPHLSYAGRVCAWPAL